MEGSERRDRGLDVFDLAEFPIGALGERAPATLSSLEFADKEKVWRVEADPRYGLPTTIDAEVYVALLAESRGRDLTQQIPFRPLSLIQAMGWPHKGESYGRLLLSLQRWDHTQIRATNAVHDPRTGSWQEVTTFRILDGFRHYRRKGKAGEGPRPWWFRWGATMAELLAAGYHHEFDTATYMRLRSPIAQAEFRYLSARMRDGKATFEQHLPTYAQQHIGLRQRYASKIKEKLAPAHRELIACGFLKSVGYGQIHSGPNRGEEKIVIHATHRGQSSPALEGKKGGQTPALPSPAPDQPDQAADQASPPCPTLADRLAAAGVTRAIASQLVAQFPEETAAQLEYWPHRDRAGMKNPAGALVKAIREGWAPPEEWKQQQAREERKIRTRERRAREATPENHGAEDATAFEAWWAALPAAQRDTLTAQARAELIGSSSTLARHFERNPGALLPALRPILLRLATTGGDRP